MRQDRVLVHHPHTPRLAIHLSHEVMFAQDIVAAVKVNLRKLVVVPFPNTQKRRRRSTSTLVLMAHKKHKPIRDCNNASKGNVNFIVYYEKSDNTMQYCGLLSLCDLTVKFVVKYNHIEYPNFQRFNLFPCKGGKSLKLFFYVRGERTCAA